MSRFTKFGIVINPSTNGDIEWSTMTPEGITEKLREFSFITPQSLAKVLSNVMIKDGLKADKESFNISKIDNFGGQLELGSKSRVPHYQLWIEMTRRVTKKKVVTALSQVIYDVEMSPAISAQVLTTDVSEYKDYCAKKNRAELLDEYSYVPIDAMLQKFDKYLEENSSAKQVLEEPYSYQKWLIKKLEEKPRTRQITWLCDIAGNAGKSIFTDVLEENPKFNCVTLMLDSIRSFKYTSVKIISDYIDQRGHPPTAIIIDAARDEETKFLHETYSVLEELNNGRLFATFHGKVIKRRMPREIPIIVFSNSPPVIRALSEDRWDIKALYRNVDGTDVYVQDAKVSSNVKSISNNSITWQNVVETTHYEMKDNHESDKLLFDMYTSNYFKMQELKDKKVEGHFDIEPGSVKKWGPEQTAPTNKAPEYILRQAQKLSDKLNKN